MKCPECQSLRDHVVESRLIQQGELTRRRRECSDCHFRYTTYERIEASSLMVTKRDQRSELYDRQKIFDGLTRAFQKRPIEIKQIEKLVLEIETDIRSKFDRAVPADEIGKIILSRLHGMDQVAYVRFASVYRKFNNVEAFIKEVNGLINNKSKEMNKDD